MNKVNILTNPKERTRFLKFAVVGSIGAIVDFGVFNLLTSIIGIQPVIASVCSFLAAVTSNFTWHRYWTYPDSRSKNISKQLLQFAFVNLIGLSIRTPIFAGLSSLLRNLLPMIRLPNTIVIDYSVISHNLALAVAVVIVMFWNFYANRFWTYNDVE